jgi:hypothetical protein
MIKAHSSLHVIKRVAKYFNRPNPDDCRYWLYARCDAPEVYDRKQCVGCRWRVTSD